MTSIKYNITVNTVQYSDPFLYLFGPQWDLRGSLLIGKFRGNQILTPGLTISNAKRSDYCTVSAYLPRLYPVIRPHVDLRCKISINLKSAHEITLETIELADLFLWLG